MRCSLIYWLLTCFFKSSLRFIDSNGHALIKGTSYIFWYKLMWLRVSFFTRYNCKYIYIFCALFFHLTNLDDCSLWTLKILLKVLINILFLLLDTTLNVTLTRTNSSPYQTLILKINFMATSWYYKIFQKLEQIKKTNFNVCRITINENFPILLTSFVW